MLLSAGWPGSPCSYEISKILCCSLSMFFRCDAAAGLVILIPTGALVLLFDILAVPAFMGSAYAPFGTG